MTAPDDTPKWLEPDPDGEGWLMVSYNVYANWCERMRLENPRSVAEWMEWRKHVAQALELVPPDRDVVEELCNKAVAAELRRYADSAAEQADATSPHGIGAAVVDTWRMVAYQLRARAATLDPTTGG